MRVRLPRVDNLDLNLFEFDYDLTMMIFFLDADKHVYARYGGRDSNDADNRQSLEGLHYTMESVLKVHEKRQALFAPKTATKEWTIREATGGREGGRGCMHCHQVKEALNRKMVSDGKWTRDRIWRYPLPENIGVRLEVNRGNIVEKVTPDSAASKIGLAQGDVLQKIGQVPIHSFGDAQYALDKAPATGTLQLTWLRGKESMSAKVDLEEGWRKTDVSWRTSMRRMIPTLPLYGDDLKADERKALGLTPTQLAFRQNNRVQKRAKDVGIEAGDIIIGIDKKKLDMTVDELLNYVQSEYLVGEVITIDLLRRDKPLTIKLTLR